jgi:hypothetical protein
MPPSSLQGSIYSVFCKVMSHQLLRSLKTVNNEVFRSAAIICGTAMRASLKYHATLRYQRFMASLINQSAGKAKPASHVNHPGKNPDGCSVSKLIRTGVIRNLVKLFSPAAMQ